MDKDVRIVDWKYLKETLKIPYSRQHFRRLSESGSAPARYQLSPKRVGWKLEEILQWLSSRPQA